MPRQGTSVTSGLLSEWAKFAAFLAVAFLCTYSWGACTTSSISDVCWGPPWPSNCFSNTSSNSNYCARFCENSTLSPGSNCRLIGVQSYYCSNVSTCGTSQQRICCSTQAEADSAYCALNPTAEGCVEEDVPSSCEADYNSCMAAGGVWKKIASTSSECSSQCDLCGDKAMTRVKNAYADMCCQKGMAPPGEVQQCYTPVQSGPGMSESVFNNKYNEWSCGARTTSDGEAIQENQELYQRFCLDGERYEEQVDTNDVPGGSSSSEGSGMSSEESGSHSWANEMEALGGLYGVLDTIRDTLVKRLTPATEKIYDCLLMGTGCTGPLQIDWTDMPRDTVAIDSAIVKLITPYLDSSVRIDSAQLKVLRALDTNLLKQLRNDTTKIRLDSAILKNDSTTRRVISGAIDDANDTTRKWLNRIADSIGVSTDSLVAHLDSIRKSIPDSILDSISKYQSRSNDYLDSILNAPGKGFTKLDSAIDSSMKYFYRTLGDLPGNNADAMNYALGYGDTATSNLRKDLEGLKGAVQGIGTGFDALGDSIGYLRGDLEGYLTAGSLDGDTGSDIYHGAVSDTLGDGWLSDVNLHMGNAMSDSAFAGVFPSVDCVGDTCEDWGSDVSDSLVPFNKDSMEAALIRDVDSSRQALADSLENAFDSLRKDFPLINFDSLIVEPLGMRVPNTNTCPDHCFSFSIENTNGHKTNAWLGEVRSVSFPFCNNLPGMNFNVFILIRIIARVFVAIACIMIGMWFIAGKKD